jgi:hypothetical protein
MLWMVVFVPIVGLVAALSVFSVSRDVLRERGVAVGYLGANAETIRRLSGRSCLECGYDLRRLRDRLCPECGRPISGEERPR